MNQKAGRLDDLDGGTAIQTVPFSLDGVRYEIVLSEKDAAALRDMIARYVAAGRRIGGRKIRVLSRWSAAPTQSALERTRAMRAWASKKGYPVSSHGRLSFEVIAAYEAAHSATTRN